MFNPTAPGSTSIFGIQAPTTTTGAASISQPFQFGGIFSNPSRPAAQTTTSAPLSFGSFGTSSTPTSSLSFASAAPGSTSLFGVQAPMTTNAPAAAAGSQPFQSGSIFANQPLPATKTALAPAPAPLSFDNFGIAANTTVSSFSSTGGAPSGTSSMFGIRAPTTTTSAASSSQPFQFGGIFSNPPRPAAQTTISAPLSFGSFGTSSTPASSLSFASAAPGSTSLFGVQAPMTTNAPAAAAGSQPFQSGSIFANQPRPATQTAMAPAPLSFDNFGIVANTTVSSLSSIGGAPSGTSSMFGIRAPTVPTAAAGLQPIVSTIKAPTVSVQPTLQPTASAPTLNQSAFAPAATGSTSTTKTVQPPAPVTTTPTAPPFSLGNISNATSTSATTVGFAPTPATTAVPFPLTLTLPTTTSAAPLVDQAVSTPSTTATSTQNIAAAEAAKPLTYQQLEDLVNKWTTDLEDQERSFLTQATQINAWDRILMENGEKILQLNDSVVTLENEQQRVDHELDFVGQQQQELEQILQKLEQSLIADEIFTGGSVYAPHSDIQREQMVQLEVNLDSQMKQIGQELSQIVDRVNVLTDTDSADDPMKQIAQVLSKQMDALQWIDEQTSNMQIRAQEIKSSVDDRRKQNQTNRLYGSSGSFPRNYM